MLLSLTTPPLLLPSFSVDATWMLLHSRFSHNIHTMDTLGSFSADNIERFYAIDSPMVMCTRWIESTSLWQTCAVVNSRGWWYVLFSVGMEGFCFSRGCWWCCCYCCWRHHRCLTVLSSASQRLNKIVVYFCSNGTITRHCSIDNSRLPTWLRFPCLIYETEATEEGGTAVIRTIWYAICR